MISPKLFRQLVAPETGTGCLERVESLSQQARQINPPEAQKIEEPSISYWMAASAVAILCTLN